MKEITDQSATTYRFRVQPIVCPVFLLADRTDRKAYRVFTFYNPLHASLRSLNRSRQITAALRLSKKNNHLKKSLGRSIVKDDLDALWCSVKNTMKNW